MAWRDCSVLRKLWGSQESKRNHKENEEEGKQRT